MSSRDEAVAVSDRVRFAVDELSLARRSLSRLPSETLIELARDCYALACELDERGDRLSSRWEHEHHREIMRALAVAADREAAELAAMPEPT